MIKNVYLRKIIERLAWERSQRGWSRDRLGASWGATGVDVWRWEDGGVTPMSTSLALWANALGYELAILPKEGPNSREDIDAAQRRIAELTAEIEPLRRDAARWRADSVTLNSIAWRMAELLGDVPDGATAVAGSPLVQIERLAALIERRHG